jgi:hypothetical protein
MLLLVIRHIRDVPAFTKAVGEAAYTAYAPFVGGPGRGVVVFACGEEGGVSTGDSIGDIGRVRKGETRGRAEGAKVRDNK